MTITGKILTISGKNYHQRKKIDHQRKKMTMSGKNYHQRKITDHQREKKNHYSLWDIYTNPGFTKGKIYGNQSIQMHIFLFDALGVRLQKSKKKLSQKIRLNPHTPVLPEHLTSIFILTCYHRGNHNASNDNHNHYHHNHNNYATLHHTGHMWRELQGGGFRQNRRSVRELQKKFFFQWSDP